MEKINEGAVPLGPAVFIFDSVDPLASDLADQTLAPASVVKVEPDELARGLTATEAEFVTMASAQTRYAPDAMAKAVSALVRTPTAATLMLGAECVDAEGRPVGDAPTWNGVPGFLLDLVAGAILPWARLVFRRHDLIDALGDTESLRLAVLQLLLRQPVAFLPDPLVRVREREIGLEFAPELLSESSLEDLLAHFGGGPWAEPQARATARVALAHALGRGGAGNSFIGGVLAEARSLGSEPPAVEDFPALARTWPSLFVPDRSVGIAPAPGIWDVTETSRGALPLDPVPACAGWTADAEVLPSRQELSRSREARRLAEGRYREVARRLAAQERRLHALERETDWIDAGTTAKARSGPPASLAVVVIGGSVRRLSRALSSCPEGIEVVFVADEREVASLARLSRHSRCDIVLAPDPRAWTAWGRAFARTAAPRVVFVDGIPARWDWPKPDAAALGDDDRDADFYGAIFSRERLLSTGRLGPSSSLSYRDSLRPPSHPSPASETSEREARYRVVLEVPTLDRGGLESVVADLARGLPACGFDPIVVCTKTAGQAAASLRSDGVEVIRLGERDPVGEIAALFDERSIDVVAAHYSWLGIPGAVARDIPVVMTLHNEYGWLGANEGDPFPDLDPLVSGYIAVSEDVRSFNAARFDIPVERIAVVRNAPSREVAQDRIPDRSQARAELGIPADDLVILCVGRLEPVKGQLLLVEAVARRIAAGTPCRLLLAGDIADERYAARITARIDSLGIDDRVWQLGVRNDIAHLLAASDLFALSSLFEGLSLSAAEALAAGTPALLSPTGDAAFLVGVGEARPAGVLIDRPPNDPTLSDMRERLGRALDPPQEDIDPVEAALSVALNSLPELRQAARSRGVELAALFDPRRPVREHAALLARAIAGRDPTHLPVATEALRRAELARDTEMAMKLAVLREASGRFLDQFRWQNRLFAWLRRAGRALPPS